MQKSRGYIFFAIPDAIHELFGGFVGLREWKIWIAFCNCNTLNLNLLLIALLAKYRKTLFWGFRIFFKNRCRTIFLVPQLSFFVQIFKKYLSSSYWITNSLLWVPFEGPFCVTTEDMKCLKMSLNLTLCNTFKIDFQLKL